MQLLNRDAPPRPQVLCPCAKRRQRRNETEPLDEPLDDSDTNTLGLSAQDLRDPAAIVSAVSHLLLLQRRLCMCIFLQHHDTGQY